MITYYADLTVPGYSHRVYAHRVYDRLPTSKDHAFSDNRTAYETDMLLISLQVKINIHCTVSTGQKE